MKHTFALCIRNDGYPASLKLHRRYAVISDPGAEDKNLLRVIDESGEDYCYPATFFKRLD